MDRTGVTDLIHTLGTGNEGGHGEGEAGMIAQTKGRMKTFWKGI
jgi:hypothetical protein